MVLTVGKYTLGAVLHADSESVVRLATHKDTPDSYAIRMLEKSGIRRRGQSAAVKREVTAMTELKHDNIVCLHEVLSSPTRIYLVMELVQGDDLGAHVARFGKLSTKDGRDVVHAVAQALAHAHARGVYHGALAPSCVLRPRGAPWSQVKLAGFTDFQPGNRRVAAANDALGLAALLALAISAQPPPLPSSAPAAARDLFARLEYIDPMKRPALDEVLRHPWFTGDEEDVAMHYDDGDRLPRRNRRRDEVRMHELQLPIPQGDSSDEDGDTFPATVPMMATIDFLPYRDTQREDDAVRQFQQYEKARLSPPSSPTSPRSPDELARRRLPRSKPVRYTASPLREAQQVASPNPIAVSASPQRFGNNSHKNANLTSPHNHQVENGYSRSFPHRPKQPSPVQFTDTPVMHRMPAAELEEDMQKLRLSPTPTPSPVFTSPRARRRRSPELSPSGMRRLPRSPAMRELDCAAAPPDAHADAPMSSSTISLDDEPDSLARLVRSTLTRFSMHRAKRISDELANAGVDDVDDLHFVIRTKRGVKGAAAWLERVTNLSAHTCLKLIRAAACEPAAA